MKIASALSLGVALCAAALTLSNTAHAQSYSATDLGTLGGQSARGYDLNNLGQVVGWSEEMRADGSGYHRRAFVYDPGTGMQALGDASWDHWMFDSFAGAINDQGQIAGGTGWGYLYPQWRQQAFMVDASGQLTVGIGATNPLLPGTGDGDASTDLTFFDGMSEDGQIWGRSWIDQGEGGVRHYLTGAGGSGLSLDVAPLHGGLLSTINPLAASFDLGGLNAAALLGGGHSFISVIDINSAGQLLALASNQRSYLVTPVPEPGTWALMLGGLAVLGAMKRREHTRKSTRVS